MVHIWTLNYDLELRSGTYSHKRIQLIIIDAEHTCLFDQSAARAHDVEDSIMTECQKLNSTVTLVQAYRAAIARESPAVVEAMRTPHEMREQIGQEKKKAASRVASRLI